MILSWTGARLDRGQYERVNINATDNRNSTCLHYAAAAGMKNCVEVRERERERLCRGKRKRERDCVEVREREGV